MPILNYRHSIRKQKLNVYFVCSFIRTYFETDSKRFIPIAEDKLKAKIERETRQHARPSTPSLRDLRDWAHIKIQPVFEEFWNVCYSPFSPYSPYSLLSLLALLWYQGSYLNTCIAPPISVFDHLARNTKRKRSFRNDENECLPSQKTRHQFSSCRWKEKGTLTILLLQNLIF